MRLLIIIVAFFLLFKQIFIYETPVSPRTASNVKPNNKITVLVIDNGIYPHDKLKPYLPNNTNSIEYRDISGHGTHVAGIIAYGDHKKPDPVCSAVQLISCAFQDVQSSNECFKKATMHKYDFINYSAGGTLLNEEERKYINILTKAGTKIITAAGNEASHLTKNPFYPANYLFLDALDNLIVVASLQGVHNHNKAPTSNYDGGIIYDYGESILSTLPNNSMGHLSGTSQATAMYTHRLVQRRCKQLQNETQPIQY